ncbi:general secretion pathway protein GspK [Candidatus Omnitrophota bacterium]
MKSDIHARDKSGVVLIIVLWILIILTMLAVGLGRRTGVDAALTRFQIGRVKAKYLALSGFMIAREKLVESELDGDTLYQCGIALEEQETAEDIFKIEQSEGVAKIIYEQLQDDGTTLERYGLTDEERRVNLNTLTYNNYKILYYLILQGGFDTQTAETIASSLIDWRDADDNDFNEPYGAEESYYSALENAYHCKNLSLESVEELLMLKDMTPDIFAAIKDFVTVFPAKGAFRINFNTASQKVLMAFAKSFLGVRTNAMEGDAESLVAKMITYRQGDDGIEGNEDDRAIVIDELDLTIKENTLAILMFANKQDKSRYFRMKVRGEETRFGAATLLEAIVDRYDGSVVSWRRIE